MSVLTEFLELFKYDPDSDGAQTFNLKQALNDNWDKVDAFAKALNSAKGAADGIATLGKDGKLAAGQLPPHAASHAAGGSDPLTLDDRYYKKVESLSPGSRTMYGLGSDAVPDDVLAFLGKYNQHWWRRRTPSYYEAVVGEYGDKPLSWREAQGTTTEIQYSDSITFDAAGVISLVDPVTISVSYTNYTAANVIKGKYFKYKLLEYEGTTSPGSGSNYSGVHLAANADATRDLDTTTNDDVNFYIVYMSAAPVTSLFTDAGQWEYLQASERNAYPDSGTSDGYEYEYLGVPFENAVTAPKIAAGSYVGTGTYGQSNPNTLEFDAPPLMVFVVGDRSFFAIQGSSNAHVIYGGSGGTLSLIWSGNSLSWYVYAEPNAYAQLNIEGNKYYYIALWI